MGLAATICLSCTYSPFGVRPEIGNVGDDDKGRGEITIFFEIWDDDLTWPSVAVEYRASDGVLRKATLTDASVEGVEARLDPNAGNVMHIKRWVADWTPCTVTWDSLADGVALDGLQLVDIRLTPSDFDGVGEPFEYQLAVDNGYPTLQVDAAGLSFEYAQGSGVNPASQTVHVANTGPEPTTLVWSVDAGTFPAWLSMSPTSGTLAWNDPATEISFSATPAGHDLQLKTYEVDVVFEGENPQGRPAHHSPFTLRVSLAVRPPRPEISIGDSSGQPLTDLCFAVAVGGGNPPAQGFWVANAGDAGSVLAWTATDDLTGPDWLSYSPAAGETAAGASGEVVVSVDASGLGEGTYTAVITVSGFEETTGEEATGGSKTVTVHFTVGATSIIVLSPSSLAFSAREGGADPISQTLSISNTGEAPLDWSVSSSEAWLTLSPTSGQCTSETDTVLVFVDIAGLVAGTYGATVTVTAPGATNTPRTLPVSLTVSPAGDMPTYVIVDLTTGAVSEADDVPDLLTNDEYKTTKLVLRFVDVGDYLTQDFYIGVFEVTQRQWYEAQGNWPSYFQPPAHPDPEKRPVEQVSWNDCRDLMAQLSSETGEMFRLPLQVEWEYAGRAGTTTDYFYGDDHDGTYMWYGPNSGGETHEVGTRLPNPWGLHDIHGNVEEWCEDFSDGRPLLLGGSWESSDCSFYCRNYSQPAQVNTDYGLRVVMPTGADLPTIFVHPSARLAAEGQSVLFFVDAVGSGTLTYQWRRNGADIPGATGDKYTTPPVVLSDDGAQFTCVVSNAGGGVESDPATLTVTAATGSAFKVIDLTTGVVTDEPSVTGLTTNSVYKTTKLVLRRVEPGTFQMGDEVGGHRTEELPVHTVNITRPFYLAVFEVTQRQWFEVMGDWPSYHATSEACPVESVSWERSRQFLAQLASETGLVGLRLPTEAEWEYACKAGSSTNFFYGNTDDEAYMWYQKNASSGTKEVGTRLPNPWGLYDMLGNVAEFCEDWYDEHYYSSSVTDNPAGPGGDTYRSTRGGSFPSGPFNCRSAVRSVCSPSDGTFYRGFRIYLDPETTPGITVTRPNGGETWATGSAHDISWYSSAVVSTVDIHYSVDGGTTWTEIATGETNDGVCAWTVPDTTGTDCVVRVRASDGSALDVSDGPFVIDAVGTVWYVDGDAPGGGDGRSWATAFQHPQAAADAASPGDSVWVAQGIYTNGGGTGTVLVLKYGVSVYGGYAGLGEPDPDARDPAGNTTVLDGGGTAYHVVEGASEATIDGFKVTGGVANGTGLREDLGGGMCAAACDNLRVAGCVFESNQADAGGSGLFFWCCNSAVVDGCTFSGNHSASGGGAFQVEGTTGELKGCTFTGNTSVGGEGSAVSLLEAYMPFTVSSCVFTDNVGSNDGALYIYYNPVRVENCVLRGNTPCGIGVAYTSPPISNCTLSGNTLGAISNTNTSRSELTNCILWGNGAEEVSCDGSSTCIVAYSCVQGGYTGTGNIGADPKFLDAANGDLRLSAGSPCIDAADGDAAPAADILGNPRVDDPGTEPDTGVGTPPYADMGAFEYQP